MVYSAFRDFHYKYSNNIYCPSQCIAETIQGYGYPQNLHIISNGYNENFKPISVEKPEKYKNKFIIVSVGRLTKEKRQELIIKAIGKSRKRQDIVLILAGKGSLKDSYIELSKKLGVKLEIVFLSQKELIETLNYADLFVQASDVETESISCLEAIACGVVPIISDAKMCATKQFALDEKSLFEKGNVESLAQKLIYG